ncbi:hypothetical protein [Streptomyces sp. JJ38]|nr:hypothetical protein [Streptomyces sp. JJ38]
MSVDSHGTVRDRMPVVGGLLDRAEGTAADGWSLPPRVYATAL